MKYIRFSQADRIGFGVVSNGKVIDLSQAFDSPEVLISFWHKYELDLSRYMNQPRYSLDEISFLPPFEYSRYFCIGLNYADHRKELENSPIIQTPVAEHPSMFLRTHASVVGHKDFIIRASATLCYDFEGELAVVIGARGRARTSNEALGMIAGYTCFMDGSARDYQKISVGSGKNFDKSGSVGPWITSSRDIPDPQSLTITTRLNGAVMQHASTSQMIVPVADIILFLSGFITLQPGDIVATGSPSGVGMSRSPAKWLVADDLVEVEISSIGVLSNRVQDEV